ncbi:MAG: transcription elongation factor subunit Spt4 [Halobacteriota archaeon]
MPEQVCRACHRIVEGTICPICGSSSLGRDWSGYLIIIDAKRSLIAKKMNIDLPGKYALKVR